MLKFNRLSQLSKDVNQIAAALEKSELIEVSDDKAKIRRSPETPLPDNTLEYWQEIKRRTAYIVSHLSNI
jgi:lupus La protein